MRNILIIIQLVVSVSLIGLILLQAKGVGLGNSAIFGGSGEFYSSKRGVEKLVFIGTVILTVVFAILSAVLLLVR